MSPAQTPDSPLASGFIASPNHGERRGRSCADSIILHYTGMPTGAGALRQLCDPAAQVSAHYLVWEDGRIDQLVAEQRRAWHAGRGVWKGERDLNSASIGIEIVNRGHEELPPYPLGQIEAVIALLRDICARRAIDRRRILAHSDIAPDRKRDPGEHFPWESLSRGGVAHWMPAPPPDAEAVSRPGREGPPVRALQAMLSLYGYGVELTGVYDHRTRIVVAAFQRRFRPARIDGEADASTIATLRALLDL